MTSTNYTDFSPPAILASWLNDVNAWTYSNFFNVVNYGADPTGVTNSTAAFYAASQALQTAGGGTLYIPPGTYTVGEQTFAGATGLSYSWLGAPIIDIQGCTKPVKIVGNGAVMKIASGLHYGSFDPVTGAVYTTMPNFNPDYRAILGYVIKVNNNAMVRISDLEIDGNVSGLTLGGGWGDVGTQIEAYGIHATTNKQLLIENVNSHHNALDGYYIDYAGISTSTQQSYPQALINCNATYNGRQGFSWIGGNQLTCVNCVFSFTGQNGYVSSAPGAGVDIEPDSLCCNGTFLNCVFSTNKGCGFVSDTGGASTSFNHKFIDCVFIGTENWSVWPNCLSVSFDNCKIVGAFVNVRGTTFNNCLLSMTATDAPGGVIYGTQSDIGSGSAGYFNNCTMTADSLHALPAGSPAIVYTDCTMTQTSATAAFTSGLWYGNNQVTTSGSITVSTNYGRLVLNGVLQRASPNKLTNALYFANDGGSGVSPRQTYYYQVSPDALSTPTVKGDTIWSTSPTIGGNYGSVCVSPSVTTTGTINASSSSLAVVSGVGVTNGDYVTVTGAGPAGSALVTTVASGGGTGTLTLSSPASTSVVGAAVVSFGTWAAFGPIGGVPFNNLTGPITSSGTVTSVASQTGTGSTFVMQNSPTLTTPNIGAATASSLSVTSGAITPHYPNGVVGIASGASVSAGSVGEIITNSANTVPLTTGTPTAVTSVSLTAGNWILFGNFQINGSFSSGGEIATFIATSTTVPPDGFFTDFRLVTGTVGNPTSAIPPMVTANVSSTTTYYLIGYQSVAASVNTSGFIKAVRIS